MFNSKKGFTLIELLIVIAIIGILAGIIIASLNVARTKSRDARRKTDINAIKTALDLYFDANESYPTTISYGENEDNILPNTCDGGGYDTSRCDNLNDGTPFMGFLTTGNYMGGVPLDPLNGGSNYYRYKRYGADGAGYDCTNPFYILQIMRFEAPNNRAATADHGYGQCPGKNWVEEAPEGYTIQVFEK